MTTNADDRLTDPENWIGVMSEHVFAGLRRWAGAQPFMISHVRRLTAGRSGSYVAVVRIRPDNGKIHHAVLKLLPPEIGEAETLGVALAKQWTPERFWDEHMVPTTERDALPGTDWWVHTQKLANANLAQLRPLADLIDEPRFGDFCGTIIEAVVDGWHQNADPEPLKCTPQSFLESFLADRHLAGLARFAQATGLDLELPTPTVNIPGRVGSLANPLALRAGMSTDPETGRRIDGPVEIFLANGHGDMQLFNVLVPAVEPITAEQFRLIDYGGFETTTPVSRDPVKLILAVAAAWLPALRPATALRSSLAELVVDPSNHPVSAPLAGYLAVSKRIYEAASRWNDRRDMPEEWRRQHLLVLIGSALRTVADVDLELSDRWWFFEVAALATRAYGDMQAAGNGRQSHPATPPSLVREPEPDPAEPQRTVHRQVTYPPAHRPAEWAPQMSSPRLSGAVKLAFVQRLGRDWPALADLLDIPQYTQRQFEGQSDPVRAVWEWLEVRDRLHELPGALTTINRMDLADLLR